MSKIINSLVFTATVVAVSSMATAANAVLTSVNGSGSLINIGDTIPGQFVHDTGSVDYTLTLNNINGISSVNWNGAGSAEGGNNPGFQFNAGGSPSLSDTWTATLAFSEPVIFDWQQTVNLVSGNAQNNGASQFGLAWTGATSNPTILDPDDQLQNELTGVGSADFRISTNPGVGSSDSGGIVFNSNASWSVEGFAASEVELTWSAVATTNTNNEWITINGDSFDTVSTSVPFEFSPAMGLFLVGGVVGIDRLKKLKSGNKNL